jgi:outer membrane protein assembly factor BamB
MKPKDCTIFFVVLILLLFNVIASSISLPTIKAESQNTDWSMYRHDLQRKGTSTSPDSNGNLLWRFNTGDKIRSSPAIANGIAYQGSNDGYIYALNAATGLVIWKYSVTTSSVESSPAVVNNVVYVGCLWDGHNGYVVALNAGTGELIWRFATTSGVESSPAVENGVVYIGSFDGYIYALNATNGALIWSYLAGSSTYSSPAIVNGLLFQGASDGNIYALNASNGELIWKYQTGSPVYASPAVVDNVVYANSDNGAVYALIGSDGSEIWRGNIGVGDHADASPAVADGIVYFVARSGLYSFNASTGSQIWYFTSPYSPRQFTGYVYSCPAIAGNIVYYGSCDGYVFALNTNNGSMVWSYQTGLFVFASPALANGVLYVGSYDGYLYALGNASAPATTPTLNSTSSAQPNSQHALESEKSDGSTAVSTQEKTVTNSPDQNQTPSQICEVEPTIEPVLGTNISGQESGNWIILVSIILTATIALATLVLVFKKGIAELPPNQ